MGTCDQRIDMDDQTIKADAGKPRLTLVPLQIIYDIARVRMYGNAKYPEGGPDNWKAVSPERYRDAAFRHFLSYIKDPDGVDAESGLPHRWHLECNLAFLAELEEEGKKKDERKIFKQAAQHPEGTGNVGAEGREGDGGITG